MLSRSQQNKKWRIKCLALHRWWRENRPFSWSCQFGEPNLYRSSILKLRGPKNCLDIEFSSVFLASIKDVMYGRQPVEGQNKGRKGRCDCEGILWGLLEIVILIKKFVATSLSLDTQSNKTFTCIIITAASLRAHSLHIHSLLNKRRKKLMIK